jgi:hypothetical protein
MRAAFQGAHRQDRIFVHRENQDAGLIIFRDKLLEDIESSGVGKPEVEHDKPRLVARIHVQAVFAGCRFKDLPLARLQEKPAASPDHGVIINK